MTSTIFWNVDTQYDFMRADGKLYVKDAETIEPNLEKLTRMAAERGIRVVNTADWHTLASREISATPDFKTTFPPHCLQGTDGAKYVPATAPESPYLIDWQAAGFDAEKVKSSRNLVLYKDEFDVFHPRGGPHTEKVLRIISPSRAIVYGVAANVCVDDAVLGLRKRGIEVHVARNAIKELPGLPLPYAAWEAAGAKLINTEDVAKYL